MQETFEANNVIDIATYWYIDILCTYIHNKMHMYTYAACKYKYTYIYKQRIKICFINFIFIQNGLGVYQNLCMCFIYLPA